MSFRLLSVPFWQVETPPRIRHLMGKGFLSMRLAFVLRLGNDTRPADGFFEGWIEEVDSCTELRFRATDELLKFLGHRFDLTTAAGKQGEATGGKQTAVQKAKRIAPAGRRKQKLGSD